MLDVDDPLTAHRFQAARIEDEIRAKLVEAKTPFGRLTKKLREELVSGQIESLRQLNATHFDNDNGISDSLDQLERSILYDTDLEQIWKEFLSFAESPGANFGTWAI